MMQKLTFIGKSLVAVAAGWAVTVSLYLFFSPVSVHTETATAVSGASDSVKSAVSTQSWYQVQGLWGSIVLILFAGLYILALYLAWRPALIALAILSVAALTLSYLAGFSIGLLYLPSALGLLIGTVLLIVARNPVRNDKGSTN